MEKKADFRVETVNTVAGFPRICFEMKQWQQRIRPNNVQVLKEMEKLYVQKRTLKCGFGHF